MVEIISIFSQRPYQDRRVAVYVEKAVKEYGDFGLEKFILNCHSARDLRTTRAYFENWDNYERSECDSLILLDPIVALYIGSDVTRFETDEGLSPLVSFFTFPVSHFSNYDEFVDNILVPTTEFVDDYLGN